MNEEIKNAFAFLLRGAHRALRDIFICAPLHLRSTSVSAKRVPPAHRTRRRLNISEAGTIPL